MGLPLVTLACYEGAWVLVGVEGGSGLLDSVLLHHCHVYLHLWELYLVTGVRGRGMWVLVGLEGRSVLLDSMSTGGVGGQLAHVGLHSEHLSSAVLEGVLEGGECWRRFTQSFTLRWTPV